MSPIDSDGLSVTYTSGRTGHPDLRLIHFNDVYHIQPGPVEPIGGIARFQSVVNYYRSHPQFSSQSDVLTLFSGDAFSPSAESSISKGEHMVPILNAIGTAVACVGNHDLDFGAARFKYLASQCSFPWLLANIVSPAPGGDSLISGFQKSCVLTASNGLKIGVLGLGQEEWIRTIDDFGPDLICEAPSRTVKRLAKELREQGAELVVALTHQREHNDFELANNLPSNLVDIILGGHDHLYAHTLINGIHILRSGSDFKQFSYIEGFRDRDSISGWHFNILRRDIVSSIPEDPDTLQIAARLTSGLDLSFDKPILFTSNPLDGRFSTVRQRESSLGNFICDLLRFYYDTDCALLSGGTIRGDQIYPPGVVKLRDMLSCFPFPDPVTVLRIRGHALLAALENGVSQLPALEGRFCQVSNVCYGVRLGGPPGSRITFLRVGGKPIESERTYTVATAGYMSRGKDGFSSLHIDRPDVEELVGEDSGAQIVKILRAYSLGLKVLGAWNCRYDKNEGGLPEPPFPNTSPESDKVNNLGKTSGLQIHPKREGSSPDDDPPVPNSSIHAITSVSFGSPSFVDHQYCLSIARRAVRRWMRNIGFRTQTLRAIHYDADSPPDWMPTISPQLEGRILVE